MAEAAPDHSASKRTVDDLFQILITRDIPAFVAKKQITETLQLGKLRIDLHIAAGARTTRPKAAKGREDLDSRYVEVSPAGGITAAVHPQSWDVPGVLALAIIDNHLVVEPQCSLDFPWQAYSFSISNPVVIDELWPRAASGPMSASPDEAAGNPRPQKGASKTALIVWAYGELLPTNELTGLRGKALRTKVYLKIGSNFTAGPRTFEMALQRYREGHAR